MENEILANVTRNLLASIDGRGVARAELLQTAGLSEAQLADPDAWVPIGLHVRLGRAIAAALPRENMGLQTGARIYGDPRGALGYCLRRSVTNGRALRNFCAYLHLVNSSMTVALEHTRVESCFTLQMVPELAALGHPAEALFAAWVAVSRHLTNSHWQPIEVAFEHQPHGSTAEHREFFGCPVTFGRQPTCLRVLGDVSELPIDVVPHELEHSYRPALDRARALLANDAEVMEASNILGQLLAPPVDVHVSRDELRRTLSPRLALAHGLLDGTSLLVHEVAYLLGFDDLRAFGAAFQLRFGAAPRVMRAER